MYWDAKTKTNKTVLKLFEFLKFIIFYNISYIYILSFIPVLMIDKVTKCKISEFYNWFGYFK